MKIPQSILDAAHSGKLVVFIGAGVSRLAGGRSWAGYANSKLEYLQKKKYISFYDKERLSALEPRKILSICDLIMQEQHHRFDSEEPFIIQSKNENCSIYKNLYRLKAIYITTNYDNFFDQVAEGNKAEVKSVADLLICPNPALNYCRKLLMSFAV